MKIIGFNLSKILAERKEEIKGNLEIDQKINISGVSKEPISFSKNSAIKVSFTFATIFSKDFAKIEFNGSVLVLPGEEEQSEFEESLKSKKIPEQFRLPIFNFIMNKCTLKTLTLEEELSLPLHVQMPKLKPKE